MAKDKNHVYSIDLDIKSTEASKQAFKELQTAFETSNNNMDALNNSYMWLERHTKDTVELEKQYNKIIKAQLDARDEEIEKLKAKKVSVLASTKLTQKERLEELKALDESIKSLETEKQQIKAKKEELKLRIRESRLLEKTEKIFKRQFNEESKKYKLAKSVVVLQEKLVGLLAKESKLRKAIGVAGRVSFKVAKFGVKTAAKAGIIGAKAGIGIAGAGATAGAALLGAAAGAANDAAEKERALGALKSGIDPSVVDQVYVKTGMDYETIVAAINNLSDVTKDSAALVQGAVLEIRNPGAGKLLLSTTNMDKGNIGKLDNAIAQIKKQTGAQDMSAALEAATKSKLVTGKKVSQTEYIQAFAALQQKGFNEDQIEKIIKDAASKEGDFIDNLNKADLGKYTRDKQMKNRLANTQLGLEKLDLNKESESSATQSTAEKLRAFELKKNELLVKFLPVVESVVESLSNVLQGDGVKKVADGLVSLFTSVFPLLTTVLELLSPILEPLGKVIGWLAKIATDFIGEFVKPLVMKVKDAIVAALDPFSDDDDEPAGGQKAQGGIVTAPALVGEAGPELVLPLDYSRAGRTSQIIQNFNTNQSFNMASNQQTPLAFSQAVGNNRFVKRVNGL